MANVPMTAARLPAFTRRTRAIAVCLALCPLAHGLSASAEDAQQAIGPKDDAARHLLQPRHATPAAASVVRDPATAAAAPAGTTRKELVLHDFSSAPHGEYPSSGVIRDLEGNLYGTTNGSYSDIGGGGTHDAGVVYKIDTHGHQSVLHSFTGGADGSAPNGLIQDLAGNLYGTTSTGGASGAGVVFEVDTAGHERVLYRFSGAADGDNPNNLILDEKGVLYGTTSGGGTLGYGVVFKIDASGNEKVLYTFKGGADGAYPNPNVALDPAGNLYGTTNNGGDQTGSSGAGVVFKVDPAGRETVLHTFTGGKDGAYPNGVIRDSTGDLYGTTSNGGASGAGVVYEISASGHQKVLYSFTGGKDGGSPDAALTQDRDGNLFGTTNGGGTANLGVVFKLERSGHETVLHTFTRGPEGNQPYLAGVILDPDGNLYGTTSFNGSGGAGAVYKLDQSGTASVVYAFPGNVGGQYSYNAGVILGSDGQLFGTTDYGGGHGAGVLYELDRKGDEKTLYTFDFFTANGFGQPTAGVIRDSAGNFYGTTFIGQADTGYGYGVVYKIDAAGHAEVLHNFTGGADGGDPYGGVILDSKGNVYGTAAGGGDSNNGAVFEIEKSKHERVLYSFTGGADGGSPLGSLIRDSDGNFYGTTNGGGAAGAGVVFKIDPSGHETVLYSFTGGADGGYPYGGLVRDSAGNLYGATDGGGSALGAGVVFKIDHLGHETVLHRFTGGDDGAYPGWVDLARDSAGNLYGTTIGGGADDEGVVFKIDPSGHETVLHSFTGGDDGGSPYAGVILGPEGQLYGVTPFGGRANVGVLFEIKP
jgi:uncharacterized repeat protein (TIGR03803 family)